MTITFNRKYLRDLSVCATEGGAESALELSENRENR